jgi:peptidoglycan-associated lipoprotein
MRCHLKSPLLWACSAALLLSGCAGAKSSKSDQANSEAQAQTYGLGQSASMGNSQAANGMARKVNQMVAPSDQTYYFAFDSNAVESQYYAYVRLQADYLVAHPGARVRLQGNTDNRGSREYNVGLGWRRDQSVQQIMRQEGVPPSQIVMVSYGKEKPAVWGDSEADWALNRRVNLVYEEK